MIIRTWCFQFQGLGLIPVKELRFCKPQCTAKKKKKLDLMCTLHLTLHYVLQKGCKVTIITMVLHFIDEGSESQREWYSWPLPPGLAPKSELCHPLVLSTVWELGLQAPLSAGKPSHKRSVSRSVMSDTVTLWTVALQAPLSMGFPR